MTQANHEASRNGKGEHLPSEIYENLAPVAFLWHRSRRAAINCCLILVGNSHLTPILQNIIHKTLKKSIKRKYQFEMEFAAENLTARQFG
ncbi:hypothetical protein F7734_37640 [Scytonema sp. UIC 10036]|nr:hypothetical protein [Scytonema sp. UIC 10036]